MARDDFNTLHSLEVDLTETTPMVRQFLEVKRQYPGVILFYQMGDFYETFFEDALIASRVLEITLTARDAGKLGKIPMAGVPLKAAEGYLAKLLSKQFKVAVCEQAGEASTKGLVERKVVRVLSSGTVTDSALLKPEENNFLAAVTLPDELLLQELQQNARVQHTQALLCGLAYCDISTGSFFASELTYAQLLAELNRIQPSEVLVAGRKKKAVPGESFVDEWISAVPDALASAYQCRPLPPAAWNSKETSSLLLSLFSVASLEGFGILEAPLALAASGAIAYTIKTHFMDTLPCFERIQLVHVSQAVYLNSVARRNLELLSTIKHNQAEGSLLAVLDQTSTNMGARLLRQWVSQPLTNLSEIHSRLDSVEELTQDLQSLEQLAQVLKQIYDIERLSTKVANLSVLPRDLIALKRSLGFLPEVSNLVKPFKSFYLALLQSFPPELFQLVATIDQAVAETPGISLKDGNLLKKGYHWELDELRETLQTHQSWLETYEQQERERTGIKTLKLQFNSAFGYFIEVTRANANLVPEDYTRKQTLTNAERYTTETLKAHEAKVLDAQARQYDLEYTLFIELRNQLAQYAPLLKECATRVAVLDVLQSFASVAVAQDYTRPVVDDSLTLNIQAGRHPVVEKMVSMGRFVPNHCQLAATHLATADETIVQTTPPQVMIITGPNMAGKSTYMRQVALIVLMAQIGSFVPASYARIGYVDSIYTRVGAVDDLSSGQSTFMVEMNETAQILNGATERSLVILDEVGRGTSTYDGVSIAWSVAEYLVNEIGCRTLFATHYHELNTLESTHPRIQNVRVCVSEEDGEIEFLHTVEPGAAQKSYGIQVAKMAGLPQAVIQKASRILNGLQKRELATIRADRDPSRAGSRELLSDEMPQLSLF